MYYLKPSLYISNRLSHSSPEIVGRISLGFQSLICIHAEYKVGIRVSRTASECRLPRLAPVPLGGATVSQEHRPQVLAHRGPVTYVTSVNEDGIEGAVQQRDQFSASVYPAPGKRAKKKSRHDRCGCDGWALLGCLSEIRILVREYRGRRRKG